MTTLIAGGTGTLGSAVVALLTARDEPMRILTRDPDHAKHLPSGRAEVVAGDVRDPDAVARAMDGMATVVSAVHGFTEPGRDGVRAVDVEGNRNLIRAAESAGAGHFVLLSVQGAAPDHPMELFRAKYEAEQALRASGLVWTIIRPTAYMETWAKIVGEPLIKTGKTTVFGRGRNPINFVSVADVAQVVALAVTDPTSRGEVIEVGGPENLTMRDVAQTFERVTGKRGKVNAVPLPMMRAMAVVLRPFKPGLARQIQAGVVMDTRDMTFDAAGTAARYPAIAQTRLDEMIGREYPQAD